MGFFATSGTKFKLVRDTFLESSIQLSNNIRTLALAAIGIIWVFRVTNESNHAYSLDPDLITAAFWIFFCLAIDMLHYLYRTAAYEIAKGSIYKKNKSPGEDEEFEVWDHINKPTTCIFYAKLGALLWGYYNILTFLYRIMA